MYLTLVQGCCAPVNPCSHSLSHGKTSTIVQSLTILHPYGKETYTIFPATAEIQHSVYLCSYVPFKCQPEMASLKIPPNLSNSQDSLISVRGMRVKSVLYFMSLVNRQALKPDRDFSHKWNHQQSVLRAVEFPTQHCKETHMWKITSVIKTQPVGSLQVCNITQTDRIKMFELICHIAALNIHL